MSRLTISVLGPLAVALDGEPVAGFEYNKVRALLVYLAVEAHRAHTRDGLATLLWHDLPERTARGNLSQALTKLRLALGDKTSQIPFLLVQPDSLQLNPDSDVEVDVLHFLSLLDATEAHPHQTWRTCSSCADQLRQAVALYRGDFLMRFFLPDSTPFEEWAGQLRQGLRQRLLTSLERLAGWAEWRGLIGQATEYVRLLVEMEPLLEVNQRALMRLLALSGQKTAALAQYEQLRRLLAQEVAAEPDAETTALYEQIKTGKPPKQADNKAPAEESRLPSPPTRLIGRESDMQTVIQRVRDRDASAITLTGPPGIGKTRLALEIASAMRFEFEDGSCFVDLTPLSEAALVPSAIAQALDITEQPGKPLAVTLMAAVKKQHRLLVLDNFEHLLEGASFVAELLAACPALQVLVTSRTPLGIRAEQQYPLAPLALPDSAASLDVLAGSPAVQLFVERAQAARPDFVLTAENAEVIAQICRRLDGLPLALELIAGRARTLAPAELLKELGRRLDALTHGSRDLPERHRTLRSAIAWSYDRLSADEQRVFAHLGVFAGGCTAEAAQVVVGQGLNVQPALEALHESSLVQAQTVAGETRFTLLETLREFALEQLAARGELHAAQQRHADCFLALAREAEIGLLGKDQFDWLERLARELANMRAAMSWSLSQGNDLCLRLGSALNRFWGVRSSMSEGRRWLAEGLKQSKELPDPVRAEALWAAGWLALVQGDLQFAQKTLRESLELYTQLNDLLGLGKTHVHMGGLELERGNHAAARSHLQEGLAHYQRLGDERAATTALNALGLVCTRSGQYGAARSHFEQALDIVRRTEDIHSEATVLNNLGESLRAVGEYSSARQHFEASQALYRQLGNYNGVAMTLINLGELDELVNDLASAQSRLREALALMENRDTGNAANVIDVLGRVKRRSGNLAEARARHIQALALRFEADNKWGVAVSLLGLAYVDHAARRFIRAAQLMGAAEILREAIGSPLEPVAEAEYESNVAALRAALGEAAFKQAWAEGHALTMEQAVQLALETEPTAKTA